MNSFYLKILSAVNICLVYVALGCGGGGGGGSSNLPPVANAGTKQVVTQGVEVTLSGSLSNDPDGQIVSHQWTQISGTSVPLSGANTVSAQFSAPQPLNGEEDLDFRLTVMDNAGASSSDIVTVTVIDKPIVDAGADQFAYGGREVVLTGTAQSVNGTIVAHLWEQIDINNNMVTLDDETAPTVRFTAPQQTGILTFRYTATEDDGDQQSDMVVIYVSEVLFSDTFEDRSNWIIDSNDIINPGNWGIVGDELFQQNNVNSLAFVESYHLGTFAHLDEQVFSASTNFRFSVDITPRANNLNNNTEGNDVGIMFPYADAQNYFRLSMSSRYGFTRLEKRAGMNFETLAVNSRGYIDNQTMTITVEVNDDTIMVFIDDEPIFAETNLTILPGTVALYCQDAASFDNVIISNNSLQPMVVVASPLAHSIALTPGDGNILSAEAVVLNEPIGSYVVFSLNGGMDTISTPSDNLYSAQLSVSPGEHEVEAILKDVDDAELYRDLNSVVGVNGNYVIAVGDSITNGVRDEDPTNNNSEDGRIIAIQGFATPLSDGLTDTTGLPQIVFNEGIPGDLASDLDEMRIVSILERHPGANRMVLLIGTNDALAREAADTFEGHLENIVNTALIDVDRVYIARILPIYDTSGNLNTTVDSFITAYNARIDQFAAIPSDNAFAGPDLYARFLNNFNTLYDPDGLHPNDAGFQQMAEAWKQVLFTP